MDWVINNFHWFLYGVVSLITAYFVIRDLRGKVITLGDIGQGLLTVAAAPVVAILIVFGWIITIIATIPLWNKVVYDPDKFG